MNEAQEEMRNPQNVREDWMLFDTILIEHGSRTESSKVEGWFTSLAQAGMANVWSFFNVRNRSIGLPYNNQDARDSMPYGLRLKSIGVEFFSTPVTRITNNPVGFDHTYDDLISHIFTVDIPRHCGCILRVQQDERLKTCVPMVPSGMGVSGGGVGRGQISKSGYPDLPDVAQTVISQSVPHVSNRWEFPKPIGVPRKASLSVEIGAAEYVKQLMQSPGVNQGINWWTGAIPNGTIMDAHKSYSGIRVSLIGDRLVQQRGDYHA